MFRVKMDGEMLAAWFSKNHQFPPSQCTQGIPRGSQLFRASVTLNGDLEAFFLSPMEVQLIASGKQLNFEEAVQKAEDRIVVYHRVKLEIDL